MRYQSGDRKTKTEILNEFTAATGYNRKYALDLLNRTAKLKQPELFTVIDGETVIIKPEKKKRPANRKGKSAYGLETVKCLAAIWRFFRYKCGKYLSPLIREQMPYLEASKEPDFHITPETKKNCLP
ncbi:MAG: hypothetical protein LBF60_07340 [Treponema sp.]|nr:hypothetical protein [Treponema sp.]